MQLAALREKAGLSQKQLARKLKTSQQNVSRLESPSYEGHSLSMLRRVAGILGATVRVVIEPRKNSSRTVVAETEGRYRSARRTKKIDINHDQARNLVRQALTQSFDKARFRSFVLELLNQFDESKAQSVAVLVFLGGSVIVAVLRASRESASQRFCLPRRSLGEGGSSVLS